MPATPQTPTRWRGSLFVFWITMIHCLIWFVHYGGTALGESPALDNEFILQMAQDMADGTLPQESFHRAPLYPFLLSVFLKLGLSIDLLPVAGRMLNALAFAIMASATATIARRFYNSSAAGWTAGLFIGLNPVLLFFSGDAFDILLATACLSISILLLQQWLRTPKLQTTFYLSLVLGVGAALRPHLLPCSLMWPLAVGIMGKHKRISHMSLAAIPPFLGFILLGMVNLQVAGEFRVMPWQGNYNLWAGNGPHANGRIYKQVMRIDFDSQIKYDNPAKLESIALYEMETGKTPPHSISEMNAHWKTKTRNYIKENPATWMGLMFRKAYYFLNSYEQYDNKTYGFHKQQHLQLKFNPIHWGGLLIAAVAGTLIGLRDRRKRAFIVALIVIFSIYAGGTILFYTTNRFRLPMLPILAVLAGGLIYIRGAWSSSNRIWKITFLVCTLLTVAITYSNFFDARNTNTWEEDYAVLANASYRTGRDTEAINWASEVLAVNPNRNDMQAIKIQSQFNLWAFDGNKPFLSAGEANIYLEEAKHAANTASELKAFKGIYEWKLGDQSNAIATWSSISKTDPFALLCLYWTNNTSKPTREQLNQFKSSSKLELLIAALKEDQTNATSGSLANYLNTIFRPVEAQSTNVPSSSH